MRCCCSSRQLKRVSLTGGRRVACRELARPRKLQCQLHSCTQAPRMISNHFDYDFSNYDFSNYDFSNVNCKCNAIELQASSCTVEPWSTAAETFHCIVATGLIEFSCKVAANCHCNPVCNILQLQSHWLLARFQCQSNWFLIFPECYCARGSIPVLTYILFAKFNFLTFGTKRNYVLLQR